MPNPFKPRVRRTSSETRDEAELFASRLQALGGLDADEVDEFKAAWRGDVLLDSEARTQLRELLQLDDDTLRRMIAAYKGELPDEIDDSERVDDLSQGGVVMGVTDLGSEPELLTEARALVRQGVGVRGLTTWIGSDAERAAHVEAAEHEQAQRDGRDVRRSLLAVIERARSGG